MASGLLGDLSESVLSATFSHNPHVRVRVVVFEQSEVVLGTFGVSGAENTSAPYVYQDLAFENVAFFLSTSWTKRHLPGLSAIVDAASGLGLTSLLLSTTMI